MSQPASPVIKVFGGPLRNVVRTINMTSFIHVCHHIKTTSEWGV